MGRHVLLASRKEGRESVGGEQVAWRAVRLRFAVLESVVGDKGHGPGRYVEAWRMCIACTISGAGWGPQPGGMYRM